MPRIKYLNHSDPFERFSVLLSGRQRVMQLTNSDLGAKVGQSHPTVKARIQHPEQMTLGELRKYAKALDISKSDLMEVLPM